MAQWGQGQPGYQYPLQTGFPGQFQPQNASQFQAQNQQFQPQNQQSLLAQQTGFAQRPGFPQQTGGFQQQQTGNYIQAQPTGFVGGNFAARSAPPPVPQIPSQFQSNPPSFLNGPPPIPQRSLLPQQTGFPGQGPLIPQVTGFVDPRLQMMSNSFMPANTTSPYGAGGIPVLQSQPSVPLQQSFQQHNAQRGTAAPRIPWALSKSEKKSYDSIFRAWDVKGTGFISGETALEVFGQSGLSKDDLARIWGLADTEDRGKLNIAEFHVAMGLIYRKLNGNEIPDQLPPELVPPSSRDLESYNEFVKDLLKNDTRVRSPSSLDAPVSRLKDRSFNSSESALAGRDATIYKHDDNSSDGASYYSPRSRHIDREAIRTRSERDNPESDLKSLKNMLSNTQAMLDKAAADDASRTAEDEALDREMDELKYRVKRIQDDLEYYSRPPRSAEKDREKRALERDLLNIMHEKIPEVERKLKAQEERRDREKRQWARDRDRTNERFGRFNDRDNDRYSSYRDEDRDRDRPYSRGSYRDDRDYDRDRDRDRDRDYERDRDYRRRSPSRDRDYGRDRPRSAAGRDIPPPPPSQPPPEIRSPPPAPKPTPSPAPALKNMTQEERQAYARAEAQRRIEARKAALGLVATPSPAPDTSVEDRLQQERKEAEEKARVAEKQAEERETLRRERLERERTAKEEFDAPPPAPTPTKPAPTPTKTAPAPTPTAKAAPPPPKPRVPPAAPPPRKVPVPRAAPIPAAPAELEVDPEEEALRAKEEFLRKQREARAARLKALEEEARREEEEQKREEERYNQRIQAARIKSTPSPAPAAVSSPPPPSVPAAVLSPPPALAAVSSPPPAPPVIKSPPAQSPAAERSKTNPFAKLMDQGSVSSPSASNGSTNPWGAAVAIEKPAPTPTPAAPHASTPSGPPPVKTPYNTAASAIDDVDWEDVKEVEDDSDSDDEFTSRGARANLATKLFSGILGTSTPPPATPTPPPSAPAAPPAPPAPAGVGAPPPPPPVAAPAPTAGAPAGDRGALFASIQGGRKLRSVQTVDKSAPPVSGRVLGDTAPPAHITTAARPPSPVQQQLPPPTAQSPIKKRESVDWFAGLASEASSPTVDRMEAVPEEEPQSASTDIPNIEITAPDLMADIDKSTEYQVRSLYAFEGEGDDDLSFAENLILIANPSKSGGEWWYGKIPSTGKAGLFPKAYVQPVEQSKSKAIAKFSYNADKQDELSFVEGDTLTIIEQTEGEWWMAEQGGIVFLVPASYLETTEDASVPDSDKTDYHGETPQHDTTERNTDPLEGNSSESDNSSDSDSDSEDDEPNNEAERDARAYERQLVLEAAGLIVNKDVQPPPRPMRKKTGSKRRPPPAAPAAPRHKHSHSHSKELPPVPEPLDPTTHIDDAFDRYESFRQTQANRLSIASLDSASSPTTSVTTSAASIREGAYSQLKNFLGRNKTPVEHEKRIMPVISAPILGPHFEDRAQSPAFGSSWSSLVDKSALEGIPPNERKRQEAIFELIATESAYVRDLQLIVEVFYSSMMPLLDQKGTTVVFANIEDILLTNTTFLSSLEERQKDCRLYVDSIGDILHSQMVNMNVYMEYCVNHSNAIKVLKALRDSRPELASHLQRLRDDPTTRNLDLSSFLLIPMQRITRYPLLIRHILHYTEVGEEQKLVQDALGISERILDRINETIRDQEGHETLKRISQHLWIGQGRLDLTAPTRYMGPRRLLREGHLMKAKSGRKLQAFLCSDILVLTDDAMKNLYRMPIALSEAQVKDLPGARDDLSFQITLPYPRGGDAVALRAMSVRDCQLWMQAIESAVTKCRTAEKRALRKAGVS